MHKNVKIKGIASGTHRKVLGLRGPNVGEAQTPRGGSDVWQTRDLETPVFGSVAMIGLTGEFSDVWQGKELGDRERREYPLPALFSELRILNDLWMRARASAHSKGVAWARIRLKHGVCPELRILKDLAMI